MHKPEKHRESGRKEITAKSTKTYSHAVAVVDRVPSGCSYQSKFFYLCLLIFYLTRWRVRRRVTAATPTFLSQVSFSWFLDQYFRDPRLSLTGRHIFFVCAVE